MNVVECPICLKNKDLYLCQNCIKCGNFSRTNSSYQLYSEKREVLFGKKLHLSNLKDNLFNHVKADTILHEKSREKNYFEIVQEIYENCCHQLQRRVFSIRSTILLQKQNVLNINQSLVSIQRDQKMIITGTSDYSIKLSVFEKNARFIVYNLLNDIFKITREVQEGKKYMAKSELGDYISYVEQYKINEIVYHQLSKCARIHDERWSTFEHIDPSLSISPSPTYPLNRIHRNTTTVETFVKEVLFKPFPPHHSLKIRTYNAMADIEIAAEATASVCEKSEICCPSIEAIHNSYCTLNSYFSKDSLASISYIIQLVKHVSELFDLYLPYPHVFSHLNFFSADKIADPLKGSNLLDELFQNVDYLCSTIKRIYFKKHSNIPGCLAEELNEIQILEKRQTYNALREIYDLYKYIISSE